MNSWSKQKLEWYLGASAERMARNVSFFGDRIPDYRDEASGTWMFDGYWTEGFWPGLLWLLHAHAGNASLADAARRATRRVAEVKAEVDDHDLGFLFYPSCVLEYEVSGSTAMLPAAVRAATRLAARYRADGRYIPAHGPIDGPNAGFAIIDTAMNLQLLYWAATFTREPRLAEIATAVARTIVREHVRADGSTCQVLWLDPATGLTQRREAVMAATVDSCWARGQAWGIHGLAQVFQATRLREFRDAAEHMANYFLSRLPTDGVVFHDLDDPAAPHVPKDSSAQAIAAGGMLILAATSDHAEDAARWRDNAERLLLPLLNTCLVSTGSGPFCGLMTRACKSLRKNQGVVSEIVFGDYYLVEALRMYLKSG